jgi:tight adherence protein C
MTLEALTAGGAAMLGVLGARDLVAPLLARLTRRRASRRSAVAARLADLGPRLGSLGMVRRLRPPSELGARLAAAGQPGGLRPRDWMALKAGAAGAAAVGSLGVIAAGPSRLAVLGAAAAPLAGFVAPDFWLARAVRARGEAALRELPDLLDLLRVSVEAGVAPVHAMGSVAVHFDGPLAVEWRRVTSSVALGESQADAIARMTERIAAAEVKAFADTVRRSRRHGLPIGAALGAQAARAREARRRRIREQAARAGPKMQLVVALVLVPSMLLIVAALLVGELQPALDPLG